MDSNMRNRISCPFMRNMAMRNMLAQAESLFEAGQTAGAERILLRILAEQPAVADALSLLALIFCQTARVAQAEDLLHRAIQIEPGNAAHFNNLGNVLAGLSRSSEAIKAYETAIQIDPQSDAHANLGGLQMQLGRFAEASEHYRKVVAIQPTSTNAWNYLGLSLRLAGRLNEAADAFRSAINVDPHNAIAHNNLGNMLKDMARVDEAIACFRNAIELRPGYIKAHSNMIYSMWYSPNFATEEIVREHVKWATCHADPLTRQALNPQNVPEPSRRLRVGYVASIFRDHPVGLMIEPILRNHRHSDFEIFCYSDVTGADAITEKIKRCADHWIDTAGLSDEALAQKIRSDGIDILVDLTLHMADNRLLAFARKPAPVQMAYLAYPATSGMKAIDYVLTDPYLDPPGNDEHFYVEQLIRLPHTYWCYPDLPDTPSINPLPAISSGHITFGALNNICKLNPRVAGLWSKILARVPNSKLSILLAGGAEEAASPLRMLCDAGIESARVEVFGRCARREYLELFNRVDVSLDPFPYNGHTTSLDSLWMGVPVITLAGSSAVSRAGVSILTNVGLPELIAKSPAEYVHLAANLAGNLAKLSEMRLSLREKMQHSALTDAVGMADALERIYRTAWTNFCRR